MAEIQNLTEATIHFIKEMRGGRIIKLEYGAKGAIASVVGDGHGNRVYIAFKRDWLHTYSTLFPQEEGKGFGQTMNLTVLRKAALDGAWVVVVVPSGAMYKCEARTWLEYATERKTIRTPSTEIGEEASIPSSFIQRIESAVP